MAANSSTVDGTMADLLDPSAGGQTPVTLSADTLRRPADDTLPSVEPRTWGPGGERHLSFVERLRAARESASDRHPDPTDRAHDEARLRRTNPEWYDLLTTMPVRPHPTGVAEISSAEVHDVLGIPASLRQSQSRRVVRAMLALGWTYSRVGVRTRTSDERVRGFRRFMRRV